MKLTFIKTPKHQTSIAPDVPFCVNLNTTIRFIITLCLCVFVILPFHAIAGEEKASLSSTAVEEGQPKPELPDGEHEKSFSGTAPSQFQAPANNLITFDPDGNGPVMLIIRNQEIVSLLADISGRDPQERAEVYREWFNDAVSGDELPEPTITEIPSSGSNISIGKQRIMTIAFLDIDPLNQKTHAQVVSETAAKISVILAEIREERSFSTMVWAVVRSIVATLVFGIVIWILLRLQKLIFSLFATKTDIVEKTFVQTKRRDIENYFALAQKIIAFVVTVLTIMIIVAWLSYVLRQFPYTRPIGEEAWDFVFETLKMVSNFMLNALPNLFTIAFILLIAHLTIKLTTSVVDAAAAGRIKIPGIYPETAMPTRRILMAVIYLFVIAAVYPYLPGSESNIFRGLTVLAGLMVSLGGQGVMSQSMSGLVLIYSRAYQAGDYVRIGEVEGVVTALNMQATKIRTNKNEEVTIPNSVVLSTSTMNYTRLAGKDGVIVHTKVNIRYSVPWRKVHEQLLAAANQTAGLKKIPAPFVQQAALSDFYVEYQLNAYLEKPERRLPVLAELRTQIQDSLNEAGIVIIAPHYVDDPPDTK